MLISFVWMIIKSLNCALQREPFLSQIVFVILEREGRIFCSNLSCKITCSFIMKHNLTFGVL